MASRDGDGVLDLDDNCLDIPNPMQTDTDSDGTGDLCDDDDDGDSVVDTNDNCPYVSNAGQSDVNGNGVGDDCESDYDGDGVDDDDDICPNSNVLHTTSFETYIIVDLDTSLTANSTQWVISDSVSISPKRNFKLVAFKHKCWVKCNVKSGLNEVLAHQKRSDMRMC